MTKLKGVLLFSVWYAQPPAALSLCIRALRDHWDGSGGGQGALSSLSSSLPSKSLMLQISPSGSRGSPRVWGLQSAFLFRAKAYKTHLWIYSWVCNVTAFHVKYVISEGKKRKSASHTLFWSKMEIVEVKHYGSYSGVFTVYSSRSVFTAILFMVYIWILYK